MMPVFYQTYLKSQLGFAEYLMLKILINLLQSIKQLGIENARNCTTISHFIWN